MGATQWIKVVLIVAVIAGATSFWMVQNQTEDRLRFENESLQKQLERMAQVETANEQLSNFVAQADGSRSSGHVMELLRLRNEVGMLRRQTNELWQLQEQYERLKSVAVGSDASDLQITNPSTNHPMAVYPKEAWQNVGYDTPENAFQSLNRAALYGDLSAIRAALTTEMQKDFDKEFQTKTASELADEIKKSFSNKSGVRILSKNIVTDNLIVLEVDDTEAASGGQDRREKLVFQFIDGVWKLAADH